MLKSKVNSEYSELLRTVEYLASVQEYITETSLLFKQTLIEERSIAREEGKRIKDKSFHFIDKISEDKGSPTDFTSCCTMFGKFFEIVGHLVSQNYSMYQKQTDYSCLTSYPKEVNKQTIVERLKELDKMKSTYKKRKLIYEKAVISAEEAIK